MKYFFREFLEYKNLGSVLGNFVILWGENKYKQSLECFLQLLAIENEEWHNEK